MSYSDICFCTKFDIWSEPIKPAVRSENQLRCRMFAWRNIFIQDHSIFSEEATCTDKTDEMIELISMGWPYQCCPIRRYWLWSLCRPEQNMDTHIEGTTMRWRVQICELNICCVQCFLYCSNIFIKIIHLLTIEIFYFYQLLFF